MNRMLKKNLLVIVVSIALAVISTRLTLHKSGCENYSPGCFGCYCVSEGGWPFEYLSYQRGSIGLFDTNYFNFTVDFLLFFIPALTLLSLVSKLITYYLKK